jgi:hypothetical protein
VIRDTDELFEVEQPNLFRDPLEDAARASRLLSRLPLSKRSVALYHEGLVTEWEKQAEQAIHDARIRAGGLPFSPIDEAWDAALFLPRRLGLLKAAL